MKSMADIKELLWDIQEKLTSQFGARIVFIGLQGSYARGSATERSDIDLVTIFDCLTVSDIEKYRQILEQTGYEKLMCGFVGGREELSRWEPSELLMFYYDTIPLMGSLDFLREQIGEEAAERAVRIGAGSVYHGCVHNMLHERSADTLRELYKAAGFVLAARAYQICGSYLPSPDEQKAVLSSEEGELLDQISAARSGAPMDFNQSSERLFSWAGSVLRAL